MEAQKFLELVGRMLAAQETYFRSRLQVDLIKAKELEKQVKAVVKIGHLEPDAERHLDTQPSFFDGGPA